MHTAIFTSPIVQQGAPVNKALTGADKVIAADCGAKAALNMDVCPSVVIGDFDSLDQSSVEKLEEQHAKLIKVSPHKDETDTQLAIKYALDIGASKITLVGGIEGPRYDHAIANIMLMNTVSVPIRLVNGQSVYVIASGSQKTTIHGKPGDLVSLISLSPRTSGIITNNLLYPLRNESLHIGTPRGVSNIMLEKEASIKFTNGLLLIVHTFAPA